MKKIKTLFVALSSAALLASCGGAKSSFREFTYKRILDSNEKSALIEKIKSLTFAKINRYEVEKYDEYTKILETTKSESKSVYTFYQKGELEYDSSFKTNNKAAEKEFKTEYHTRHYHALFDEENLKYANSYENEQSGEYSYLEEAFDPGTEDSEIMNRLENSIVMLKDSQVKALEDQKGNITFVFSKITESNQLVTYASSKKNFHKIQKEQKVAELNKDLTLKSITTFVTVEQNRDPQTNEFYKKTKLVQTNTESRKFFYGDRAEASAKIVELRQKAKEGYCLSEVAPTVKGKAFKEDGTQIGAYNFVVEQNKQFEFGKRHYVARYYNLVPSLGEDVSTVKLQVIGQSFSNAVADPVAFDLEVPIASLGAGNSGLSLVEGAIKLGKNNVSIKIEFDLEATAAGAVASNVAAYAILSTLS